MTEIINMKEKIDYDSIDKCAKCIKNGGLVVFPTETVYGIGANAYDKDAVSKIFLAKNRPSDNPLIVHVSDKDMINMVVKNINEIERRIIDIFMPGPITLILPKKDVIPDNVSCNLDTVGIRMPLNSIATELINRAGVPIAAPSANISGKPSGTDIDDIKYELNGFVDYMINYGICKIGIESTVVKVISGKVVILRPGKITPEDLRCRGFDVLLDTHVYQDVKENEVIESPGMIHRHYAPNTKTVLVGVNECNINDKIYRLIEENKDKKILVIGAEDNSIRFRKNISYISYGNKENLDFISRNIFSILRKVDKYNVDLCIIEGVRKEGIGIAIMNRLVRACGYNVIYD